MALADEWKSRRSSARQAGLTNPDEPPGVGAVDDTFLATACTDATADFKNVTGEVLDLTNAAHVKAAVIAVDYWLLVNRGPLGAGSADAAKKAWQAAAQQVFLGLPSTDSVFTPSIPDQSGGEIRPAFDPENLEALVPAPPGSSPARNRWLFG